MSFGFGVGGKRTRASNRLVEGGGRGPTKMAQEIQWLPCGHHFLPPALKTDQTQPLNGEGSGAGSCFGGGGSVDSGPWKGAEWVSWGAKVFPSCPSCLETWHESSSTFLAADGLCFYCHLPSFQGEVYGWLPSVFARGLLPTYSAT